MLQCKSFFESIPEGHDDLFVDSEPVWHPLKNLKTYLNAFQYAAVPEALVCGRPLPETVVLHEGKVLTDDLSIEFGDATKGKLIVRQADRLLADATVLMAGALLMNGPIQLGRGVLVESGALIKGPAIIGERSEIRQGAYIRGYCLAGSRCVIGHATEVKHSIFLDDAKAGHFAYLGDSILGNRVNLGATFASSVEKCRLKRTKAPLPAVCGNSGLSWRTMFRPDAIPSPIPALSLDTAPC